MKIYDIINLLFKRYIKAATSNSGVTRGRRGGPPRVTPSKEVTPGEIKNCGWI